MEEAGAFPDLKFAFLGPHRGLMKLPMEGSTIAKSMSLSRVSSKFGGRGWSGGFLLKKIITRKLATKVTI